MSYVKWIHTGLGRSGVCTAGEETGVHGILSPVASSSDLWLGPSSPLRHA